MKEDSMHSLKVENVLQQRGRLCTKKLKSVKFRIIVKRNLSPLGAMIMFFFFCNFCHYVLYFKQLT